MRSQARPVGVTEGTIAVPFNAGFSNGVFIVIVHVDAEGARLRVLSNPHRFHDFHDWVHDGLRLLAMNAVRAVVLEFVRWVDHGRPLIHGGQTCSTGCWGRWRAARSDLLILRERHQRISVDSS